jgi:hypothetical protein
VSPPANKATILISVLFSFSKRLLSWWLRKFEISLEVLTMLPHVSKAMAANER